MSEELPEREYIINWFGIGRDLVQMLKEGLSPIQCMKRLRQKRLREHITWCKDCKHFNAKGKYAFTDGAVNECFCDFIRGYMLQIDPYGFCAWSERKEND